MAESQTVPKGEDLAIIPEVHSRTIFRIPQRANVERCIEALQALDSNLAAHLEATQLAEARAALVFAYWARKMHKPRALLDAKREKRILARLRENEGDVSELLYCIDGAEKDDFLMGRDERATRPYNGVETIFRDRAQVERLAERRAGYQKGEPHPLAVKYHL